MNESRLQPLEAAKRFIADKFPYCQAAVMAGSVVRGEHTATSDLDIVVFDDKVESAYRESFIDYGWPIETFVHNLTSYKDFFKSDCERARPSLPRMVSEGLIIIDSGVACAIKIEADELLKEGPAMWSKDTLVTKRYILTDVIDDLIGSTNRAEEIFIANTLADKIHEFVLRTNGQWVGDSKWVVRALKQFDEEFAGRFVQAFDVFYRTGGKDEVIGLADEVLKPHGGRLFEGYSMGKGDRI
ncbi:nucleotidyltransferase domain-containing protein [Sporosarcina sp. YIM B06819]|uniref:nucleotidyltransferase domain-containing protein n=1 Tax=Sporosarcina sp. YIM B06819 TaxID=3081769 RepID=UPI00298C94EB|nr:nucleotidyltransferase domain-containing protein [Sporosarcina sp. YIM B06819]